MDWKRKSQFLTLRKHATKIWIEKEKESEFLTLWNVHSKNVLINILCKDVHHTVMKIQVNWTETKKNYDKQEGANEKEL